MTLIIYSSVLDGNYRFKGVTTAMVGFPVTLYHKNCPTRPLGLYRRERTTTSGSESLQKDIPQSCDIVN
jgi:hypothetical protein